MPAARNPLECVLARSDGEAVVVNLDIEPVAGECRLDRSDPKAVLTGTIRPLLEILNNVDEGLKPNQKAH
jgi:hypothetical protein